MLDTVSQQAYRVLLQERAAVCNDIRREVAQACRRAAARKRSVTPSTKLHAGSWEAAYAQARLTCCREGDHCRCQQYLRGQGCLHACWVQSWRQRAQHHQARNLQGSAPSPRVRQRPNVRR